ncbi:hypothetical protein Taro_032912 [Colocasia esculenta]|uniref:mitogen-activated protein kinase kinase kinase n=1 Tax=Colocasia esculenta TaxID=4460 RepID=A0A843VW92_COLES|nr:hypothetical protein [Colocasia esculenta]
MKWPKVWGDNITVAERKREKIFIFPQVRTRPMPSRERARRRRRQIPQGARSTRALRYASTTTTAITTTIAIPKTTALRCHFRSHLAERGRESAGAMHLVRAFQATRWRQRGDSTGERESSLTRQTSPKSSRPTLKRCNASRYTDPEAWGADSDESAHGGAAGGCDEGRLTRTLDILPAAADLASVLPSTPFPGPTSFRISGEVEGEFDAVCRSLGLSDPDDFAITPGDWAVFGYQDLPDQSRGKRAAEVEGQSKPPPEEQHQQQQQEAGEEGDGLGDLPETERFHFEVQPVTKSSFLSDVVRAGNRGGGIKGARPPLLSPPPPMSLPVVDRVNSTWDILWSLAPDDGNKAGAVAYQRRESSPEPEEEDNGGLLGENAGMEGDESLVCAALADDKGLRMGETAMDLVASSSFWTSIDDDSSSTTTEGPYTISPVGRLRRNIGLWTKGDLLGRGSFGTVYEAMSDDGFFFAVKEVYLHEGMNAQLEQEIALLSQFEHENIVQYLGTAKEETKLCIFLELVSKGSLASLYQRYHLRDSQVSAYTRQILNGLRYLHDRNVVHRDIKCANILVDANGSVKLADFGLAKEITKVCGAKSCKGSAYWMAPEVVQPRRGYGPSADIWSLGCTVLEMLTQKHPFPDLEWTQAIFLIGKGRRPPLPDSLSRDARDFIEQCVQVDPERRPSASKLLDHPFVKRLLPTSSPDSSMHNGVRRTWLQR